MARSAFPLRISASERARWDAQAARDGYPSLACWLRAMANRRAPPPSCPHDHVKHAVRLRICQDCGTTWPQP
jgi:hypothetical protein